MTTADVDLLDIMFLALVQGFTEWLPVSSSGHLVIAQQMLGVSAPVGFDVALHAGTLIALLIFFRREIAGLFHISAEDSTSHRSRCYLLCIFVGTIPIAVTGLLFNGYFESLFSSTLVVGLGLLFTAILLQLSRVRLGSLRLSYLPAFLIGIFQAFALVPGISRSGSTISVALLQGIPREEAFRFSFLLSIPAVIGAIVMEISEVILALPLSEVLLGMSIAAISGYLAIAILKRMVMNERFHLFSYYCAALGAAVLLLL